LLLNKKLSPLISDANNALIYYSAYFFVWVNHLKTTDQPISVEILKKNIIKAIAQFKIDISKDTNQHDLNDMVIYCLCTFLDETIMTFQIKTGKQWNNIGLLKTFYKDSLGGEKFFIFLEKSIKDIKQHINLIEFIYVILCLGYEGKYFQDKKTLNQIKSRLFDIIYEKLILDSEEIIVKNKKKHSKSKKILGLFLLISISLFLGLNLITYRDGKKAIKKIEKIENIIIPNN